MASAVEIWCEGVGEDVEAQFLTAYAERALALQHPGLLRVLDVCTDEQGRWALVHQAIPERRLGLVEAASVLAGPRQRRSRDRLFDRPVPGGDACLPPRGRLSRRFNV
jgi:hypothetical protein